MTARAPLLEVVRQDPLVVLAVAEAEREAELLAAALLERFPAERFIAIICAERDESPGPLIAGLAPALRELIFTAADSPRAWAGDELAMHALEQLGVGQDFVFTVPKLPGAIDYALGVLAPGPGHGWDGTAVLVAGSHATVAEARRCLADAAGPA